MCSKVQLKANKTIEIEGHTLELDAVIKALSFVRDEKRLRTLNEQTVGILKGIIKQKTEYRIDELRLDYKVGSTVFFNVGKKGFNVEVSGTISKFNKTSVTAVNCSDGKTWRVRPASITKVIGETYILDCNDE